MIGGLTTLETTAAHHFQTHQLPTSYGSYGGGYYGGGGGYGGGMSWVTWGSLMAAGYYLPPLFPAVLGDNARPFFGMSWTTFMWLLNMFNGRMGCVKPVLSTLSSPLSSPCLAFICSPYHVHRVPFFANRYLSRRNMNMGRGFGFGNGMFNRRRHHW